MNSGTVFAVFGVLGLASALFFFWAGLKMQSQAKEVREHGVPGEAEITGKRSVRRVHRGYVSSTLYVTFRFNVGAETYTQEQEVGGSTFAALSEGAKVQILYLPRNPKGTAQLSSGDNSAVTGAYSLGGGCLIAAVLLLIMAASSVSSVALQANATQTSVATLSGDLAVVRAALEPHFAAWKEFTDQAIHRVSPAEVGLSDFTQETIVYGYCTGGVFYVFVPRLFKEGRTPDIHYSDAYGYTSKPDDFCWPPGWLMTKQGDLGSGWFLSLVVVTGETPTPSPR